MIPVVYHYFDKEFKLKFENIEVVSQYDWEKPIVCAIPLEKFIIYDYENNEYRTKPCFCFENVLTDKTIQSKSIRKVLHNSNNFNYLKKILKKDYTNCVYCPSHIENNSSAWTDTNFTLGNYGEYGRLIVNAINTGIISPKLKYPYTLNIGISKACNSKCITCRSNYIYEDKILTDDEFNLLVDYCSHCYNISIGTDGETFFSKTYRKLLETDLHKGNTEKISIFTNGILMNEYNWNKIHPNNRKIIKDIKISLDASNEELYNKIRTDKMWNSLMRNIDFIKTVKEPDCVLSTTYTISKFNYMNIDNFIEFALNKGFNKILFSFARPRFNSNKNENDTDFILDSTTKNQIAEHIADFNKLYNNEYSFVGLF